MHSTLHLGMKETVQQLKHIISNGGPDTNDYSLLNYCIANLSEYIGSGLIGVDEIQPLLKSCDFLFDNRSIMGHIRMKPHGYAGDFEIIERIYEQGIREESYRKWDSFALANPAAVAVRNRKQYFIDLLSSQLSERGQLKLCNVASGPGRDLFEMYKQIDSGLSLQTTCIEMDANAIAYARKLTLNYRQHINFIKKNILRFDSEEKFDLVWSAGLFDYFDDNTFIKLLSRFGGWLRPEGEIVIGNFNDEYNPSRAFMELFGDWKLKHRSEDDLIRLACEAGYSERQLHIGREPEAINLFLHIKS